MKYDMFTNQSAHLSYLCSFHSKLVNFNQSLAGAISMGTISTCNKHVKGTSDIEHKGCDDAQGVSVI